ncbi:MAG TPA: MFS transporter [Rhodopila sp.]|uniref:MFS transporter n=1 Tax=Rhodopila sp. TaxID=2480087 RepID=UPI002B9C3C89|nr:MFS transporter [Rhodopila sp.]HVY15672.1 MFS transporter [Rhodopila sp.]
MAQQISPTLQRMRWFAVALCTFAIALNYIDRSTLAVGNLKIRESFALTAAGIGALQSAWSLTYAFAQLPIGAMIDRIGTKRLVGWALVLWSLAQAAGGVFTSFTGLLASRIALGVFECPAFPGAVRCVSDWFHPRDRGRPTGVYTVGGDLGRLIGLPIMTALMLALGWRGMFVAMGVIGLVGAVGWFVLYRDPDLSGLPQADRDYLDFNQTTKNGGNLRDWTRLFSFRSMWGLIFGAFCSGYVIWMYGTWLPGFLEMQHHVSIGKTGVLAMIPLACSIIGSQVGGHATDWLAHRGVGIVASRKIPTVAGFLLSAAFCALAAYVTGLNMALVGVSGSMFFLAFAQTGHWTLITAVAPHSQSASVSSIQNFGSYLGGTVSPLLTGIVVDATGSFDLALALGAAFMIAGAFFYGVVVRDPIDLDEPADAIAVGTNQAAAE